MTHLGYPTAFVPPVTTVHPTTAIATVSPLSVAEYIPISSSLSSTQLISAATSAASDAQVSSSSSAQQVFEAVAPDTSLLVGFGVVVVLCIVAGYVWANEVVPVSRTKLAISKSRGEVREYLDELRISDETVTDEFNATTTMMADGDDPNSMVENSKPTAGNDRGFERWLFTDWLSKPTGKGGRQKEPALPILKDAKWNSGDNPVLVTAAIMMLGVVIASVTERIAT
eukprot:CAMPEP_0201662716 /NCGR_PEP_ID=MMETSP0494-20130426/4737_1 /ASSEMBLY_ACC=CAM_ASM_000839 /TAXON_ID=420259 /ORGANISM="Thalassiosira gravida, Strain GMp14c1" /LENGTH=226 /DNA_ID=CAMNT_0048141153 /DNA_START=106 /DNA_END=786 /DNA_ORIENTATION=-